MENSWHNLCKVREDILKHEITMSEFAADLYAVKNKTAIEVYNDPELFFNRTYPTDNMKILVKDVLLRLSGNGGKPILTLQVTYGGGKTHTLITLLHLAENGHKYHDNNTVKSFYNYAGVHSIPKTRVAILPFDKFDYHKGLTVVSPEGKKTVCKTPWGSLAYQLMGELGLEYLREHEDNYTPPAQPILEELLKMSARENNSNLILIDEAVIYCRTAVNSDPSKLGTLKDFFQMLTQAVSSQPKSVMVTTLIASQIEAGDNTGKEVLNALQQIFNRFAESQEPVSREDVPEILRRRLFENVADKEYTSSIIDSIVGTYDNFDELTKEHKGKSANKKIRESYPFHPELLNVFQGKWTDLSKFQKTRGLLRLLASVMSNGIKNEDDSLLINAKTFLTKDNKLSSALWNTQEILEQDNWMNILSSELEKARESQLSYPALKNKEIEQSVITTFLHSQPKGKKANTSDIYSMIIYPNIDKMSFDKGLDKWREVSWYLKEDDKNWQLTTTPNLTNMHVKAMESIDTLRIKRELVDLVGKVKKIAKVDSEVKLHKFPNSPKDVPDDGTLRFLIFNPYLSISTNMHEIPDEIKDFFLTTTNKDNPRTYINSLIGLVTDSSKLSILEQRIKKILAWRSIEDSDVIKELDDNQKKELKKRKEKEENDINSIIEGIYSIYITVDEAGKVEYNTIQDMSSNEDHFTKIKKDLYDKGRFLDEVIDYEELLPNTEYNIWGDDEKSKKVSFLVKMFSQFSRLPKLLSSKVIYNSLINGIKEGKFVAYIKRPDGSEKIYWKIEPALEDFDKNKDIEISPIDRAIISILPSEVLINVIEELRTPSDNPININDIKKYFDSNDTPQLNNIDLIYNSIKQLIFDGKIMGKLNDETFLKEEISIEVLSDELILLNPPSQDRFNINDIYNILQEDNISLIDIWNYFSQNTGYKIPWVIVKKIVEDLLKKGLIEIVNKENWPCKKNDANIIKIKKRLKEQKSNKEIDSIDMPSLSSDENFVKSKNLTASSALEDIELQDLPNAVIKLKEVAPNLNFKFNISIECINEFDDSNDKNDIIKKLNEILQNVNKELKFE